MMIIRAVYENGNLRLLEPLDLEDGQEVALVLVDSRQDVLAALGDLVMPADPTSEDILDEEAILREMDELYEGPPASQAILDERQDGP
jgi:predicted DNA-binding antitoxin AbrB/MazE fold protein